MYLLDTNVVSELRKISSGKADIHVTKWANHVDAADLYLSVITVQELEIGVQLLELRDTAQGLIFRTWLDDYVLPSFEGRILPIDTTVAKRSAKLHIPNPRPFRDGLIAATALVHKMTVVTRNARDFEPSGVSLINPWMEK